MDENQPSPRRRFQFRLRTLMTVVTLLAVGCWATMWVVRDRERLIRERDEAVQREADTRRFLNAIRIELDQTAFRFKAMKRQLAAREDAKASK